ncbi:serine/threonine-protein kinase 11-interacting protein isoform X1 [Apodemus sylvaticus]|uniref:serine/threonine-protein kinase 11-interacting protein isoform X1 n=1 Tax=Apodemus sylvaticus TaxID=10129 RepID=UPI002244D029|nr:serine/threonine-protein kinase 11-interacting protein isoform X1 [Apodemus sylvaticus]
MTTAPRDSVVWKLAGLLRESGDAVLSGCSTLSLLTATLQQLNRVLELYLGPWGPGQTGFVALPSHPADSPVILQLQFLFDVLQKTLSLKLVHIPGVGLPGPIKIFPFKSLRQLELRGVPIHSLCGLRGVYSQLESLVCHRSIQALEELLSACGGDLCSALPWLALLSADFSYNALRNLDSSLRLLSALRFLNLSHNQIQDCQGFLMDLSELYHLDVSYNHLHSVPRMGPSGAALGTLILRANELRSLQGLEQLKSLRHLDVAYNLLEGHTELAPLWLLPELRKLSLEGNPLWFHPAHRATTAQYLSPRARDAAHGFLLDGKVLSLKDLQQTSESSGLGPMTQPLSWPVGSTTETSGGPELSDSLSSGGIVAQAPLRKVKSRVRVRRASISEPSDTDPELRTLDPSPAGWFVQQHRELELLASFRERFGCDWLQYRSHLETMGSPPNTITKTPALSSPHLDAQSLETACSPPAIGEDTKELPEVSEEGRVKPEPQEGEKEEQDKNEGSREDLEEEEEQEQKAVEAELCRPMLVCPLQGIGRVQGKECFLRVTCAHLVEVELQAARTLERLELRSLVAAEVESETGTQGEPVSEGSGPPLGTPILVLRFSYLCPDRQLRRYAVLEPEAHEALQELLQVLTPFTNVKEPGEAKDPQGARFQCLRCRCEFKPEEPRLGLESDEGWKPLFENTESPVVCPNCGSDHVVLLAVSGEVPNREQNQEGQSVDSACDRADHSGDPSVPDGVAPQESIAHGRSSWSLSPSEWTPGCSGFRSVDHRLRLFLDVEVFSDSEEEFQCCIKVPVVLAGHTGEFLCLVVVSDHMLYLLKVTGAICGPPAGWLQPTLAVPLQDLSGVELGLAGQSLRLEWAAGTGSCVLLPRDARQCRAFLEELTGVLQSLPRTQRNCIRATEEEVTPQHRLWPLLGKDTSAEVPQFFYLRAFLAEGSSTCPVSLLLTLSALYLLDDDPAVSHADSPLSVVSEEASEQTAPRGPGPSLQVRDQQPLSSLSSVQLYRTSPLDLRLIFYDEVSRLESFWALHVVCGEQLTALLAWIREPWEELFSIGLRTVTQEALDLDR